MLKNFFEQKEYNTPVYETTNFVVIPSLGSLVEGWLLIVPKVFYLNFGQLPKDQYNEVHQIINHLEKRFLPLFQSKQAVLFEHGPANMLSKAGCGVDYAHLHWVPTNFDLRYGVSRLLSLNFEWKSLESIIEIQEKTTESMDYLLLRDQFMNYYFTQQQQIPSQTFRKVIAHYLNQPENFDWKINWGSENIRATYSKLNVQI